MTIRSRLNRLLTRAERDAARPLTGAAHVEAARECRRRQARWEGYFAAGIVLPPFKPVGWDWPTLRRKMAALACARARQAGIIAPDAYLPHMDDGERDQADKWMVIYREFRELGESGEVPPPDPDVPEPEWRRQFWDLWGVEPDEWFKHYQEAVAAGGRKR